MLTNEEIENNLKNYKTRVNESSENITELIVDFFSNILDSYDDFLFSIYLIAFFVIIFGSYMFDPFQISSTVPILFLFTWIIIFFSSCFLYGIYKSKDLDVTILPLYAIELLYGCGYLLIMVAIFFSVYYVIKKMLIHMSITSIVVIVTLLMLSLSLFYSMTKDKTSDQETNQRNSFLTFFLNLLFVIPCLFVDFYDVVVKDIKQAPSSTFTLISIISVILILYYVLPFIQRMKTRDKKAIQLQEKAQELNTMVASITKKELKEQQFEKKSFVNKQILNLNERIQNSLPENMNYDKTEYIRKQLEHHKVYTQSNDDSNLSLEFTYLKDISMCGDSAIMHCNDDNKITCDGVEVKNDIGMFQTCFIDEPNSYFGKLFKKSNNIKHPSYYVDLLKNNEDLMTFYMEPSSNPISFQQFCKMTTGGTEPYTIGCVNYDDASNSVFKNDDSSTNFVIDNSDQLIGQSIFVCDTTNKSVNDSDKYHVIHGYNDICNQEIPFYCKPKTLQKKSTAYSDYRGALRSEYDTYQEGQMVYYNQRVVKINAIHYSEDNTPPTYDIIYMLPPSTGIGTKTDHEKGDLVPGVLWDELSNIENKGVLSILTNYIEGFASYNPDVHTLDKNINDKSFIFTGFTRPEEKRIIENLLKNSNYNVEEQVKKMEGNIELEQDLITFLTNNENVSNIMDNLYEMNLGSDSYLSQEASKLVGMINRANNIHEYNYHFAISFWVYFDPEVLKVDMNENPSERGMIMNYANVLNMFYHHRNHSIVVEVHDNKYMKEIYESKTISFQKWNHFVFNYSYGTLDLFINNNLMMTKKKMTPQYENIGDNEIILKFGDDDKPLKHCGICNIQYFEIPLKLDQIESLYAKKGNPCK